MGTDDGAVLLAAQALTGLPYRHGRFDCMHLAVHAQQVLWGRTVRWPADRAHPVRPTKQAAWVMQHLPALARRLGDDEVPEAGCAVLFNDWPQWHVGTLLREACGTPWVLHVAADGCGSLLQPLRELVWQGLKPEGFYRWL